MPAGADKSTREARRTKVEQMMSVQSSSTDIVRAIVQEFKCSERTVYLDIDAVIDRMASLDFADRRVRKNRMRRSWQVLYQQCLSAKDFRAAAVVLDRLCRLDGLYEQAEVAPPAPGQGIVSIVQQVVAMAPIERQKAITELEEKRRRLGVRVPSAARPQKPIDIGEPPGADDGDDDEEEADNPE